MIITKNFSIAVLLCSCIISNVFAGVGESAVTTLVFPYGARSGGMGEVGTSLADDESALYYNPAGLGIQNPDWQWGAINYFTEPMFPALKTNHFRHYTIAGYFQPVSNRFPGGFGAYFNRIFMGKSLVDPLGRDRGGTLIREGVFSLGWGFNLKIIGDSSRHYGIAYKIYSSKLAPGLGEDTEGTGTGFAIDLGLLRVFRNHLRFGFTMMNIGPSVFYVSRQQEDPIPFTMNCALGYKNTFYKNNVHVFDIAGELRLDKELVNNNFDGRPDPVFKAMFTDLFNEPLSYEIQEINYHAGIELGVYNTLFFRQGFLFDYIGERYEMTMGAGLRLLRHIAADYSIIIAPEGFLRPLLKRMDKNKDGATGVRHLQWRLNFSFTGIGKFKKNDRPVWEE